MRETIATFALTVFCVAAIPIAATAQESETDDAMQVLEEKLAIPSMDCDDSGMSLTCISTYLAAMEQRVPEYMDQQVSDIRENVTSAEQATERFDNMITTAIALEEVSAEGGDFSAELDRIGALIQSGRDRAAADPDTADLVARFEANLGRWENVREDMLSVSSGARDLRQALERGRSRSILLMELEGIEAALGVAEESVEGLTIVLSALQEMYNEANRELEEASGTD